MRLDSHPVPTDGIYPVLSPLIELEPPLPIIRAILIRSTARRTRFSTIEVFIILERKGESKTRDLLEIQVLVPVWFLVPFLLI